jgi:hypothetical protein
VFERESLLVKFGTLALSLELKKEKLQEFQNFTRKDSKHSPLVTYNVNAEQLIPHFPEDETTAGIDASLVLKFWAVVSSRKEAGNV